MELSLKYPDNKPLICKQNIPFILNSFSFEFYYLSFETKYELFNLYIDVQASSLDLKTKYWYPMRNLNAQLRTDEYEDETEKKIPFLPSSSFLKQSSISNFFSVNMVDTPRCFQKSLSLYKPIFETPHLKFLHILMRHGRKEQIFASIFKIFITHNMYTKLLNPELMWVTLIPVFSNIIINSDAEYRIFLYKKLKLTGVNKMIEDGYLVHPHAISSNTYWELLLAKYKPLFMFQIRKVDKSTRKHSRGKSGKYVILWKYVPIYRRLYAVLRWLIQDISFQKAYKFKNRFLKALEVLKLTPQRSVVVKNRNFIHNYVFQNYKKTLLQTLQTVS